MRVALDTNGLYTAQAGVARYIRGLLRGFEQARPASLEISALAWEVENFAYAQPARALKTAYRELWWAPRTAPALLRRRRIDLLHGTSESLIPAPPSVAHVVTLHDLAAIRYPHRHRRWQGFSARMRRGRIARADRIICISRFTADEAIRLLDVTAGRLDVVHNGCDFHPDDAPAAEERPGFVVPDDFFLFVGSLEPGKNLALLKRAYLLARDRGRPLAPLLIVGARRQGVVSEGAPPPEWRYLGHQPDATLVYLYRRAAALVFPSQYEGFGLPVAEAMALGCPVICSRVASLPEVAGDAAWYADATPDGYAAAMWSLADDGGLRRELADRGREQAMRFSWRRCADETNAVYEHALRRIG